MRIQTAVMSLALVANSSVIAQVAADTQLALATDDWKVSTFAHTLRSKSMSIGIDIKATPGGAAVRFSNGESGAPLQISVGFEEARITLEELACDGYVLVADTPIRAIVELDANGTYELTVPLDNPALAGFDLYMQAFSIAKGDKGPQLTMSRGVHFDMSGERTQGPRGTGPFEPDRDLRPDLGDWIPGNRAPVDADRGAFEPDGSLNPDTSGYEPGRYQPGSVQVDRDVGGFGPGDRALNPDTGSYEPVPVDPLKQLPILRKLDRAPF